MQRRNQSQKELAVKTWRGVIGIAGRCGRVDDVAPDLAVIQLEAQEHEWAVQGINPRGDFHSGGDNIRVYVRAVCPSGQFGKMLHTRIGRSLSS